MECTTHESKLLTHYSTTMREFVCQQCIDDVFGGQFNSDISATEMKAQ